MSKLSRSKPAPSKLSRSKQSQSDLSQSSRAPAKRTTSKPSRTVNDSMGRMQVPPDALWGAQTQRAVENFPISGWRMPRTFIRALGFLKASAAEANGALGEIESDAAREIVAAALAVAAGEHDDQFPVDVFQTGSGTSTNMNANEVIAALAAQAGTEVHPNDDVNRGQSSNDVIPSAISVSASIELQETLLPALAKLIKAIDRKARQLGKVVKTGRTHLMDAMPITFGQELGAWSAQLRSSVERLKETQSRLRRLPLGGTAVGTGINAHPKFGSRACAALSRHSGQRFTQAESLFAGIAGQESSVELSGQLNVLATTLMKISNDLRWMNSGPLAGLGEIALPALQPGSSIMPGKVNPVVPEAVCMVCAHVMGQHVTVSVAGQSGNFQLNTMLPLVGYSLLTSQQLLAQASLALAERAIAGLSVNLDKVSESLALNPVLATALNPVVGYEMATQVAKLAASEKIPVLEAAERISGLSTDKLKGLLRPSALVG